MPAQPHYTHRAPHRGRGGRRVGGIAALALAAIVLVVSLALIALLPASVQRVRLWSHPAVLADCSAPGAPAVLFPSDTPQQDTGPGAVVWSSAAACGRGSAARIAPLPAGQDLPGAASSPRSGSGRTLALSGPIAAAAAPHGRILLAARAHGASAPLLLSEGAARASFATPRSTGGPTTPLALATAYLGDVGLVSPGRASSAGAPPLELRIHRYYQSSFGPPVAISSTPSRLIEGLTLAMDYRSDALVVWEQGGRIYARDMPGSGRSSRAVQRVAAAAPGARIQALLSDDNRAILAWTDTRDGTTSVYAELTARGLQFAAPRLLERFADPHGSPPPGGSLRLVRLASESVMLAWSGAAAGHWVVRSAAVDLHGVGSIATISAPGREALLMDLAAGPDDEAYALWAEPREGGDGPKQGDQALFAARGIDVHPDRTIFAAPEPISAPGSDGTLGEAAVGVDPDSDRAIAAWRTADGAIDYSSRMVGRG